MAKQEFAKLAASLYCPRDCGLVLRLTDAGTLPQATASARGIASFLKLAQSEPGIPIQPSQLDKNEWLLNVQNGTINLKTGELKPHEKSDYITKLAPVCYTPSRTSERWERFVSEIMAGDEEMVGFLQRLCGYWLTGSTREHVLPMFHGDGSNGKSVFLSTLRDMLGKDYAMHAPPNFLLAKNYDEHSTGRADLFGKRLATCVEIPSGRTLDEALVKELTGGDEIRARFMRKDHFQFRPTHKLVLAANHLPIIRSTDNGIWRRVLQVPFKVIFDGPADDKTLPDRLGKELHGVLTWCIAGCLEWQRQGLAPPSSVVLATSEYRGEQDVLSAFFEERCTMGQSLVTKAGRLYEGYVGWCEENGNRPDNSTVFGRKLTERGIPWRKAGDGSKLRVGIGLIQDKTHDKA